MLDVGCSFYGILWSVCLWCTTVKPVKMAELIKMLFLLWTLVPKELCVRLGIGCSHGSGDIIDKH